MRLIAGLVGFALLLAVLRDAFETIILPRRVSGKFRLTSLFYRGAWRQWRTALPHLPVTIREHALSWFGPLSLLVLLALWALSIVIAFALLQWAAGSALRMDIVVPHFLDDLYLSGTTFFTLGMGDVVPRTFVAKLYTVWEAGIGFAFLAIIIGYLPVVYQAFSRREIAISLLDARAGSPPSAGELLRRHESDQNQQDLTRLLVDWERWAAEVLESHLSYPVLAYFRSQHRNQSWLAALTTILDTSALVIVGFDGWHVRQAHLTFAMARHAAVDLAQVFRTRQPDRMIDRLSGTGFAELVTQLHSAGMQLLPEDAERRLADLRGMYEPYVAALADYLVLPLPAWSCAPGRLDNWQAAPWKTAQVDEEHF